MKRRLLLLIAVSVVLMAPVQAPPPPDCSNAVSSKLLYSASSNSYTCGTDQTGGGGGVTFVTIGNAVADTSSDTLTVTDSATIDFTTTNNPEDLTGIVIVGSIGTTHVAALDAADTTTGTFADALISGVNEADEVNPTLGTQTQGNFVASVATTAPVTGGAAGSEGAALTIALNQNAGTDVTADLEEDAHCTEHDSADVNCSGETITLADNSVAIAELTPDPAGDDQVFVSDSASAATWRTVPDCDTAATSKLLYDQTTNTWSCGTDQTGGGAATTTIYAANGSDTPISVAPVDPGTALASRTITVAAGDIVTLEVEADIMNNSGGTRTYTQRCRIASTTLVANSDSTTLATAATRGTYRFVCRWYIRSTTSLRATAELHRTPTTAAGTTQTAAERRTWNTSASNWTGSQTFALNISSSAIGATQDAIVNGWKLTHQANNP